MRRLLLAALVLPLPLLAAENYQPLGEVQLNDRSASFDEDEVRGPRVSVSKSGDDRWVGRIGDMVIDGTEKPNGVRGANFALYVERVKDGLKVRGNLDARTVSILIPDDQAERYQLAWTLKGQAAAKNPPPAQFAIAVAGAMFP